MFSDYVLTCLRLLSNRISVDDRTLRQIIAYLPTLICSTQPLIKFVSKSNDIRYVY